MRLSVASDDFARVALNGKVVLDGAVDEHRDAHYFNDVLQLDASAVHEGVNVLAALVYNNKTITETFFDLELGPRPTLSEEELDELQADDGHQCSDGTH